MHRTQMLTTYLSTSARTPQDSLIQGDLLSTTATTEIDPLTNWDTVHSGGFLRHFVIRPLRWNNEVLRNPSPDYKPTDIMNRWHSVILCSRYLLSRDGLAPTECQGPCGPRMEQGRTKTSSLKQHVSVSWDTKHANEEYFHITTKKNAIKKILNGSRPE